jgi:micrococcal nuclease
LKSLSVILFIILAGLPGSQVTYHGKITRVIDGDTFIYVTREGSFRVRSYGIDAPEGNQPFGRESAAFLSRFIGRESTLKVTGTDRYHRKVGTLFIRGEDINLREVKEGYAWYYRRYLSDKRYQAAQEYARKHRSGLWRQPDPVPPWNWRQVSHGEHRPAIR